jgi:nucleotide-binding universal stress UspA family protein
MKTILIPFDFSEYALAALQSAKKIAAKAPVQLISVTVIPSQIDWDLLPEKARKTYPDLQEELDETSARIPEYLKMMSFSKNEIQVIVKIGVPAEQILRVIDAEQADLVVLGTYGKGFSEGKFIGSTLQNVLRNAPCPVLAVKKTLDGNAFRKLAFASTFTGSSKQVFDSFIPFVKLFSASLHLVFVNTPEHFVNTNEAERAMAAFSKGNEEVTLHSHVVNDTTTVAGIHSFCVAKGIAIVALVSVSRKGKPSYQIGTTETLIYNTDRAVLSIKAPQTNS